MPPSLPRRPHPVRAHGASVDGPRSAFFALAIARHVRAVRLRIERARLATRIRELRDLVDVPHELAEVARARIDRLSRRERALSRLMG